MPAWLLPAALAAADFIGSEITGRRAQKGQERSNEQNIALAREQMSFQERMAHSAEDFSERMSNTAYQRKVADLRAAGLNPALAYEGGGASSPTGVTAGGAQARVENTVASAMAAKQIRSQIQMANAAIANQTAQTQADVRAKVAAAQVSEATRKQIEQTTDFNAINQPHITRQLELQNILHTLGLPAAENEAELEKWIKEQTKEGRATGNVKTLSRVLQMILKR
jgi:hypothetical protein